MFIVTRCLPFIFLLTNLYLSFTLNENPDECRVLNNIDMGFNAVSAMFSECFFILRTYALWNNSRIVLAVMLSTFFTFLIVSIGISFATTVSTPYATSAIPGITGCYQSSTSLFFIPFLLFSIFQLGLMMLTVMRAIQSWRKHPSRLYAVLVNHNISYYTCGLLILVTNTFVSVFLHYAYGSMLHKYAFTSCCVFLRTVSSSRFLQFSPHDCTSISGG